MTAVLELRNVSKEFNGRRVVDDVTVTVERGALFSLVGPSGCGKSTSLRMIAGLTEVTSGDIRISGNSVTTVPAHLRPVNTVFQNYALFPHLTVERNIAFGLERKGTPQAEIRERVARMLALLRIESLAARRPAELSGGERQRVALARSLVLEPEVLLLDEPLSALDPALRQHVRQELRELQRRIGTTFILVTHDRDEALSLSDRLAVMHEGRIQQIGTPQELYRQPSTRFVAGFLGAVNWIEDNAGVRPEHLRVSAAGSPDDANSISGVVEEQTYLGSHVQVRVRSARGVLLTAEVPASTTYCRGDRVSVFWSASDEIRGVSR